MNSESAQLFPPQAIPGRAVLLKPNMALVMVPRVGRLSAIGRKVLDSLLFETQRQVQVMNGAAIDARHLFEAPLKDILKRVTGQDSASDPRTQAKKALLEMRRLEVDWEAPDASTGVIWQSMGVLSEAILDVRGGLVWVKWAFPPSLLTVLADPTQYHYTQIDLEQSSRLQNYTAIALYQICRRYKTSPTGVTCRCPPDWWVDALTNTPAVVLPDGSVRRREWRKLKSESVLAAVKEINLQTDIEVELLEFREGRMVTQVQFAVRRKALPAASKEVTKISDQLIRAATDAGLSLKDVSSLVKQGYAEAEVLPAIVKLQARLGRPDLVEIQSRLAYLRSLLEEMEVFRASAKHVDASAIPVATAQDAATASPLGEGAMSWLERRSADVEKAFRALEPVIQQSYAERARELYSSAGWMTPAVLRRLQASDWRASKLVYLKVREIYARETWGDDWNVEPGLFGIPV